MEKPRKESNNTLEGWSNVIKRMHLQEYRVMAITYNDIACVAETMGIDVNGITDEQFDLIAQKYREIFRKFQTGIAAKAIRTVILQKEAASGQTSNEAEKTPKIQATE